MVWVLDTSGDPLMPRKEKRAGLLLERGHPRMQSDRTASPKGRCATGPV